MAQIYQLSMGWKKESRVVGKKGKSGKGIKERSEIIFDPDISPLGI